MKLKIQLVPSSSFYKNARQIVTPQQWKTICKSVYSKYYYTCAICGGIGKNHPVEAHEIWEYNDKNTIQILLDIIAVCPSCHTTIHFGLAQLNDKRDMALKHFMKVNSVTRDVAEAYIANEFMVWARRSSKDWKLDVSVLKKYDIDLDKINVPIVQ